MNRQFFIAIHKASVFVDYRYYHFQTTETVTSKLLILSLLNYRYCNFQITDTVTPKLPILSLPNY